MSDKLKKLLRAICFLLVFSMVFLKVQAVFIPNRDWPSDDKRTKKNFHGLFNEQSNTIDLFLLGASHMYEGVSAPEIYRQTGIHPYIIGTPGQRVPSALEILKAVMAHQSPKVVAIDVGAMFLGEESNRNKSRWQENLDALPISKVADRVRLGMKAAELNGDSYFEDEYIERSLLPLLHYHTNFILDEEEYYDLHLEQVFYRKGYEAKSEVDPVSDDFLEAAESLRDMSRAEEPYAGYLAEQTQCFELNAAYIREMASYCRERGAELLLMKVPVCTSTKYSGHWSKERHELVQGLADELGIRFLDLNYEDVGIDWSRDSKDGGCHMNLSGTTKVSTFISDWIMAHYAFDPVRSEKVKHDWDYQLALYDWEMEYYRMQMRRDPIDYFDHAARGNYTILAAVSRKIGAHWNQEYQEWFDTLTGNDVDLGKSGTAFALVSSGGAVYEAAFEDKKCSIKGDLPDGTTYSITSDASKGDGKSSIKVNGAEMACSGEGLAVVVYDNDLKCVVDSIVFDFDDEAGTGSRGGKKFVAGFRITVKDAVDAKMAKM